jgi:hypothetical protein
MARNSPRQLPRTLGPLEARARARSNALVTSAAPATAG